MQPILAESAPRGGRALVYAAVFAAVASLAALAPPLHHPGHRHHHRMYGGPCPYTQVVR